MLSQSLTNVVAQSRIEELHRAGRKHHSNRRSPVAAFATRVTRAIAGVFDDGRSAADEATAAHGSEPVGHGFTATWSRTS